MEESFIQEVTRMINEKREKSISPCGFIGTREELVRRWHGGVWNPGVGSYHIDSGEKEGIRDH